MSKIKIVIISLFFTYSHFIYGQSCASDVPDFKKIIEKKLAQGDSLKDIALLMSDRVGFGLSPQEMSQLNKARLINSLTKSFKMISKNSSDFNKASSKLLFFGNENFKKLRAEGIERKRAIGQLNKEIGSLGPGAKREALMQERKEAGFEKANSYKDIYRYLILKNLESSPINFEGHILNFWFNHFNINFRSPISYVDGSEYIRKIQSNLCQSFESMLLGSSQSMAMMIYLNNNLSMHGAINENYAREIMELHTFGKGPRTKAYSSPYDQNDIINLAKLLTGWGVDKNYNFKFSPSVHYRGAPLKILNQSYSPGFNSGVNFIRKLARHSVTKRNICSKLSDYLYGSANNNLVNSCIKAYGQSGNLSKMYSAIVSNDEFWLKSAAKTKSPLELASSSLIKTGYDLRNLNTRFDIIYSNATKKASPAKSFKERFYPGNKTRHIGLHVLDTVEAFTRNSGQPLGSFDAPTGWEADRDFYLTVSLMKSYDGLVTYLLSQPGFSIPKKLDLKWANKIEANGLNNKNEILSMIQIEDLGASEEFIRDENIEVMIDALSSPRNYFSLDSGPERKIQNLYKNQVQINLISKSNLVRR